MSIRLLQAIFLSGVYTAADGATLSLAPGLEADLVGQGKAVWVENPIESAILGARADDLRAMGIVTAQPSNENGILATDYLAYAEFDENTLYRFGKGNAGTTFIYRVLKADGSVSSGIDSSLLLDPAGAAVTGSGATTVQTVWAWDDYQLAQYRDGTTQLNYLYKSIDNFATCGANAPLYNDNKAIFTIGWNKSLASPATNLTIMAPWSLCRATNNLGEDVLIFGQYNTNASRTAGGANDWSHVWQSKRQGDVGTWECVLEMNTAGVNIVRHCHAVKQDPQTGFFWILYGDDYNSGIYVWDGIHAIDANVRPSAAAGYTGWFGMDQFNNPTGNPYNGVSTDVIFEADEVIIPLDNGTALAQRGVYACKRDLSNFRRVWDGASGGQVLNQDLYSTAVCPLTGTAVMSVLIPGASVGVEDYKLDLFTSLFSSGYKEWTKVGRYELNTLVSTSRQFIGMRFRDNGDLILASANGAGKDAYSSAVCRISGAFDPLGDVECVHPVYWVDPIAGNDGNTGYTPTSMWKTVKYAITANRVPFGCLVSVGPGYSDEGTSTITPAWKTTGRPGRPEIPVWVRGAGRKATTLAVNLSGVGIQMATALYPIRFSKLHATNVGTGYFLSSGASVPVSKIAQFDDVYLSGGGSPFRQESARFIVRQFEAAIPASSSLIVAQYNTGDMSILVEAGAIVGGQWGILWTGTAGSDCVVQNVTGINQTTALVEALAAAVIFPTVRNCAIQGTPPALKDSRSSKTSIVGVVYNNAYAVAPTTFLSADTTSFVGSLGLVTGTAQPTKSSVLKSAGGGFGPVRDMFGAVFGPGRREIGAVRI